MEGFGFKKRWTSQKTRSNLKEKASSSREESLSIVNSALADFSQNSQIRAPLPNSMKRMIQRTRREHLPADPENVNDFAIHKGFAAREANFGDRHVMIGAFIQIGA